MNEFIELHTYINWPKDRKHELGYEVIGRHIICLIMKAPHVPRKGYRNGKGKKRCTSCECYFMIPEYNCPCCGFRLRCKQHAKATNPYASKERELHEVA